MTYLPPLPLEDTTLPIAYGKDLQLQIRLIDEMFARFYPLIDYEPLQIATTPSANPQSLTGEAGTTKFDPLWGESVPDAGASTWVQPHADVNASGGRDATKGEVFAAPVQIRARVRREARDRELKRWGFDKVRELLVTIPLSLLDQAGITVRPGDRFVWDGDRYMVKQYARDGYFKNTNVRVYIVINADHWREGA